jgi:hypothetical protein
MRKQQWINVLRNIEKLKKLVRIIFINLIKNKKFDILLFSIVSIKN